jgi:3D (Asp-Asp-Asp) domain-containing protein
VLSVWLWVACGPRRAADAPHVGSTPADQPVTASEPATAVAPAANRSLSGARHVKVTLYHVAVEPCPDAHEAAMPKCGGGALASVSSKYLRSVTMQGTGKLCDGRVVGVHTVNPLCFREVKGVQWGMTASGRPALPFRSIAVDPHVFALGHWYYAPELDGVVLPAPNAGERHDGCLRADDHGGGIKGAAIDVFVGDAAAMKPLVPVITPGFRLVPDDGTCARAHGG